MMTHKTLRENNFKLWQLTPDRAAEWREIRLDALSCAPDAFGSDLDDWADRPLTDFAQRLATCEVWAAGPDLGQPRAVGGWEIDISPAEPDLGWITSVYTRPEARGMGLSDAIFRKIIANAAHAGMTRLGLHVGQRNLSAQRLYLRNGFVETGGPPMLNGRGIWEIEMRRML